MNRVSPLRADLPAQRGTGPAGQGRGARLLHLLAAAAAALLFTAHVVEVRAPAEGALEERAWPGDPLFFDVEVRGPGGELISRPRVIGEAGKPTRVELWGESAREGGDPRMCIVLDPLAAAGGLDMSFDLSVRGMVENHRSRLRMPMNELQTVQIPTDDGRSLDVTLRAFRVGSEAFAAYVDALERRAVAEARGPEA
jgi:hypothetical protein